MRLKSAIRGHGSGHAFAPVRRVESHVGLTPQFDQTARRPQRSERQARVAGSSLAQAVFLFADKKTNYSGEGAWLGAVPRGRGTSAQPLPSQRCGVAAA
jgi:hypothetical protein